MFFSKKKKIKELTDTGKTLAITAGVIFGISVGTSASMAAYEIADKICGNTKENNK